MHPSGDSWTSCIVKINMHTSCTGGNPSFTLPNITKIKLLLLLLLLAMVDRM